jgi:hypothetical protein
MDWLAINTRLGQVDLVHDEMCSRVRSSAYMLMRIARSGFRRQSACSRRLTPP